MTLASVSLRVFAKDGVSPIFQQIGKEGSKLSAVFGKTDKNLARLKKTQNDISSLRRLNGSYRESSRELDKAQKKLVDMRRELANTKKPTRALTDALRRQERQVGELGRRRKAEQAEIKKTTGLLKRQGVAVAELAAKEKNLAVRIEKSIKLRKARQQLGSKLGFSKGGGILKGAAAAGLSGQAATQAGSNVVNLLSGPAGTFVAFEKKMSDVFAAVGTRGSQHFSALTTQAEKLGASTSFSATQVAEAQEILAKAGTEAKDIVGTDIVAQVLTTAKAGGIGLEEAAGMLTSIKGQFGKTFADIPAIGDTLAAVATDTKTDFSEMALVFRDAGPVAKSVGVSMAQMASHIKILGDSGISASVAGTGLKNTYLALSGTTTKQRDIMADLGVMYANSDGSLRDSNEVLLDFNAALQDKTEAERNAIKADFAGKESLASFNVMLAASVGENGELNEKVKELSKSYEANSKRVKGAAKAMADLRSNNTDGKMKEMDSAVEGLSITIGRTLKPVLNNALQIFTSAAQKTNTWIAENQKLARVLMVGVGALGAVVAVGGTVLTFVGGAAGTFLVFSKAIGVAMGAFKLLSIAFGLSPIGLITYGVIGLVGAVGALIYYFDDVKKAVTGALGPLGEWLGITDEVDEQEKKKTGLQRALSSGGQSREKKASLSPTGGGLAANQSREISIQNRISVSGANMDEQKLATLVAKAQREAEEKAMSDMGALQF